ncbi:ABC transporter permease [Stutzerimonas stutzeri]|uniref:ABC transporter permease n=1 Tax=Stutzerimonas stutzeri TaxID=316 RepID=W8R1H2_STUST|nr:DUF4198 domain-containing protein [Stutzerimonas stutzeri]AHL76755.1 ABC transporter permease [Stutzerimonas stutzeri]MCQ4331655.1 DUF4198 domain-containing protein [Stutzerimonas stutzeri]
MKPMIKWTALALAVCLPLSAQAHRAWMLPSATVLSGEDPWITVDAAVSNDLFYFEHFPLRLKGIGDLDKASAGGPPGMRPRPVPELQLIAPDGSSLKAENGNLGRYRSTFDLHLTQKGTYKLAVANDGLFASWKEDGKPHRWMGKADSFAKDVPSKADDLKVAQSSSRMEVFVTSGNPTKEVLKPTGKGLELSPVTHPNDLFAGEAAEFVFLLDGQPAADVEISVIPGGNRYRDELGEIKAKTDAQGKISITWPEAGMYWLEAELKTDKGVTEPATERRASYSATLEVLPQ